MLLRPIFMRCAQCGHDFEIPIEKSTAGNNHICPKCNAILPIRGRPKWAKQNEVTSETQSDIREK